MDSADGGGAVVVLAREYSVESFRHDGEAPALCFVVVELVHVAPDDGGEERPDVHGVASERLLLDVGALLLCEELALGDRGARCALYLGDQLRRHVCVRRQRKRAPT